MMQPPASVAPSMAATTGWGKSNGSTNALLSVGSSRDT